MNTIPQFDNQSWAPTRMTPPIGGELRYSAGPRLIELVHRHWRQPDGELVRLDLWQQALLSHILELLPPDWPVPAERGRLRYRQAVASMGRQNGKSLLGGCLGLYGLVQHVLDPSVVGVATSVEQARIVYNRVLHAVSHDELLSALLRSSGTRGISWRDGRGGYAVYPAKAEGLQSVPVSLAIADELHLMRPAMWDSLAQGQRARAEALLVGITTAGDDESLLLKRLYAQGQAAIDSPGEHPRFGFWVWEAEGTELDEAGLAAANPAIACGRVSATTALQDIRSQPVADQRRYGLNQWVAAADVWVDIAQWDDLPQTTAIPAGDYVAGVAITGDWEWCTITAAWPQGEGSIGTEVVLSAQKMDIEQAVALLQALSNHGMVAVALEGRRLGDLGQALTRAGIETWALGGAETARACADWHRRVATGTLSHSHNPIARQQLMRSRRKTLPGGDWVIASRGFAVDMVTSMIWATHVTTQKSISRPLPTLL